MSDQSTKRILIFVHYNAQQELAGHVLYTLREIRHLYDTVVFVSNSALSENNLAKIGTLADRLIVRDNSGYDFCAWQTGLENVGWALIRSCNSLTLMNDSCFGPLYDFGAVYKRMESAAMDFWGLTIHPKQIERSKRFYRYVPEHLQSYFMVFHQDVLNSDVFRGFWQRVVPHEDIWDVIVRYEMKLTGTLRKAGFKYTALADGLPDQSGASNLAHYEPGFLIDRGIPFIKIKSFVHARGRHALMDLIAESSPYPLPLIEEHIESNFRPDLAAQLLASTLAVDHPGPEPVFTSTVAILLDVSCATACRRYLDTIRTAPGYNRNIDCYVAAPAGVESERIKCMLDAEPDLANAVKDLLVLSACENPWINLADTLKKYQIVGYFKVSGSICSTSGPAAIRDRQVFRTLVIPMGRIVAAFEKESSLGIVSADIPFLQHRQADHPVRAAEIACFKEAVKVFKLKRKIQLEDVYTLMTPYANCFWYRAPALEPLHGLLGDKSGAMKEGDNQPLAMALKLLPIYVAWATGFRHRVATNSDHVWSHWSTQLSCDESQRLTHKHVTSNCTWLLGHAVLYFPYQFIRAIRAWRQARHGKVNQARRPGDDAHTYD